MHFCYLCMALLTSVFAVKAFTDPVETDVDSTTSRTAPSLTFVRDDLAASAATKTPTVDDEDRKGMKVSEFAKMLGKEPQNKIFDGIKMHVYGEYIEKNMTPKDVYDLLDLSNPNYKFLVHLRWLHWMYLLCQLSRHVNDNEYKFIITAMSVTQGPEELSNNLVSAVKNKETKPFAIQLISVANDQIKSRVFEKLPQLDRELSMQKEQSPGIDDMTPLGRIDAYLKKHVTLKMLDHRKFHILTSYLSVLFSKDHAVGSGQNVAYKCFEDAALLKRILSLDNFHYLDYIKFLVSFYLKVNVPPSKVVSMLVQDVPEADQFTILFSEGSSRSFWLHYLEQYNERNHKNELTHIDFEQLLQMLYGITMKTKEPKSASSDTAISTWLKVLTAPHIKHLQTSQRIRNNLMSMWRNSEILPSEIVSALMLDEAKDKCFTIIFLNGLSRTFWIRYFKQYIQTNFNNVELMQSATADFDRLVKTLFAVAKQTSHSAYKYVAYSTILKVLLSPSSTHLSSSHDHVIELISILLLDRILPSMVVTMLTHGEADADKFKILFVNKSSKNFWLRYLEMYFDFSSGVENFASTANTEFQHLLFTLHAAGVQELATDDKLMVSSTILKMLISPEIAKIVDHRFLEEMVLTWLNQRIPPSDVVSMLVLEEEESDYLQILFTDTPSSELWEDYTKAYYAGTSARQNHMMSTLYRAFGYEKLKRILKAALTVEATREKTKALFFT